MSRECSTQPTGDEQSECSVQPNEMHQATEESASPGCFSLKDVLESEYFLSKIFMHLVDDGLQECRRVCKKWNETIKQLPLKLEKVPSRVVSHIAEAFPNATSFDVEYDAETNEEAVADDAEDHVETLGANLCRQLRLFNNLKSLAVTWPLARGCLEVLQSQPFCDKLQSLQFDLKWMAQPIIFFSQIWRLTNLTSLDVRFSENEEITVEPLMELKKIKNLCLPYHLFNKYGELLLPDLTNLQHLDSTYVQTGLNNGEGSLEEILRYASSLQSIVIEFPDRKRLCPHRVKRFWTMLESCVQLDSVEFQHFPNHSSAPESCPIWSRLQGLTDLRGVRVGSSSHVSLEDICPLTNLQSLSLSGNVDSIRNLEVLSCLSQLTHLSVTYILDLRYHCCGNYIYSMSIRRISLDNLCLLLDNLPNLESLCLRNVFWKTMHLNINLEKVAKLKSLVLRGMTLKSPFFLELAALEWLTELCLVNCKGMEEISMADVTLLTQLETLSLQCPQSETLTDCIIEANFPRLKYLQLPAKSLNDEQEKQLYQNCPCLRQIQ